MPVMRQTSLVIYLILTLMVTAPPVTAQQEAEQTTPQQQAVSSESGSGDMWAAQSYYDQGQDALASSLYGEAESSLREALRHVPPDTVLKEQIERSLYLDLPISAVNTYVTAGRIEEARALLTQAISLAEGHPSFAEQLQQAQSDLLATDVFNIRPAPVVDGAGIADAVYRKMIEYRQANGRYPPNRRALERWLPDGRPPLKDFRVSYYNVALGGYSMVLQNRTNPEQTLRIDATGRMQ